MKAAFLWNKKSPEWCLCTKKVKLIPSLVKDPFLFFRLSVALEYLQLSDYFEQNCISESQFGFRKSRSTTDAIESLVKIVSQEFEIKDFAQATFCDLSKAFDCVDS